MFDSVASLKNCNALKRATESTSTVNHHIVIAGFKAKGIPEHEIRPRENVLTFDAWRAVGRSVKRGEKGVRVVTSIPVNFKEGGWENKPICVFHISQTEPLQP